MVPSLYDVNYPLVKNNNALLAFAKADVPVYQRRPLHPLRTLCSNSAVDGSDAVTGSRLPYKMKDVDELKSLKVNLHRVAAALMYARATPIEFIVNQAGKELDRSKKIV